MICTPTQTRLHIFKKKNISKIPYMTPVIRSTNMDFWDVYAPIVSGSVTVSTVFCFDLPRISQGHKHIPSSSARPNHPKVPNLLLFESSCRDVPEIIWKWRSNQITFSLGIQSSSENKPKYYAEEAIEHPNHHLRI